MKITEHFTLEEFTASQTAARRGIDNSLPDRLFSIAGETLMMMERIRAALSEHAGREVPVNISSGYRCTALNRAIGGSPTSDHVRAMATDWTARKFGDPYGICQFLAPRVDELGIGQLIHEFGAWVHVSTKTPSRPINRIITIGRSGVSAGIVRA